MNIYVVTYILGKDWFLCVRVQAESEDAAVVAAQAKYATDYPNWQTRTPAVVTLEPKVAA